MDSPTRLFIVSSLCWAFVVPQCIPCSLDEPYFTEDGTIPAHLEHTVGKYTFSVSQPVTEYLELQTTQQSWLALANCFMIAHEWYHMGQEPNITVFQAHIFVCKGAPVQRLQLPVLPLAAARWGVLLACTASLLMHYG